MKKFLIFIFILCIESFAIVQAQQIVYSDYEKENTKEQSFEVIGKLNNNYLVFKNYRFQNKFLIFDSNMQTKAKIDLKYLPEKAFVLNFVVYTSWFYMIYQYEKKNVVYCMAIKLDTDGKIIGEPTQLDSTHISAFTKSKIYKVIASESKEKILILKSQNKNDNVNLTTILLKDNLQEIKRNKIIIDFDNRRDDIDNFLLDNDGDLIFSQSIRQGNKDNISILNLLLKPAMADTLTCTKINLENKYLDEVKLNVDNLNSNYIINSFFYKKNNLGIEGLFTYSWSKKTHNFIRYSFIPFLDSLRDIANNDGLRRFAFDGFLIKDIIIKKDGGYILAAEDYQTQSNGNNRSEILNNINSIYYNNLYGSRFYNDGYSKYFSQSVRYFYQNIILMSITNDGKNDWNKIIIKNQMDDDDDDFLSFFSMKSGGQVHYLFNANKKYEIINDQSVTPMGLLTRNATLKSQEKGYEFMVRYSKQVGSKQIIIPCNYRGFLCFAKVDF